MCLVPTGQPLHGALHQYGIQLACRPVSMLPMTVLIQHAVHRTYDAFRRQ